MELYKRVWMSIRKRILLKYNRRYYVKFTGKLFYLLDMRNRVDRHIDASSEYERRQLVYLFSKLKAINCNCFIDIGSHWGLYSLHFANEGCFSDAKIFAFEPDKVNRYQLYANLFLNKMEDRIRVYGYALSNRKGKARFHHFADNNRGRSGITSEGETEVEVEELDNIVDIKGQAVGIKIDVEGHEVEAISGMSSLLKNNVCVLQVESFESQLPEVHKRLLELGYEKINKIDSDNYYSNEKTSKLSDE